MITTDSADESLIKKRQREIEELKQQRDALMNEVSSLNSTLKDERQKNSTLQAENDELKNQLLIYEHDPIICEPISNGFAIQVWNIESNSYETFAQFYDVGFEQDLEEFCSEFVLELKDAYMV